MPSTSRCADSGDIQALVGNKSILQCMMLVAGHRLSSCTDERVPNMRISSYLLGFYSRRHVCSITRLIHHVEFPICKALFRSSIHSFLMHGGKVSIHCEGSNIGVWVRISLPIFWKIQTWLRAGSTKQSQGARATRWCLIVWLPTPFSLFQVSPLPKNTKQFLMPILGNKTPWM